MGNYQRSSWFAKLAVGSSEFGGRQSFPPVKEDAWLLAALVMGNGKPSEIIGCADFLNACIPMNEEWIHAGTVLGELGLIEPGTPFPIPTLLAQEIFKRANGPGVSARSLPELIFAEMLRLPRVAEPVHPPTPEALAEAYTACLKAVEELRSSAAYRKALGEWKSSR
jgi:hypothetical protein